MTAYNAVQNSVNASLHSSFDYLGIDHLGVYTVPTEGTTINPTAYITTPNPFPTASRHRVNVSLFKRCLNGEFCEGILSKHKVGFPITSGCQQSYCSTTPDVGYLNYTVVQIQDTDGQPVMTDLFLDKQNTQSNWQEPDRYYVFVPTNAISLEGLATGKDNILKDVEYNGKAVKVYVRARRRRNT